VLLVLVWSARWPVWLILVAMPASALAVAIGSPGRLVAAFNPVALNLSVAALACVVLLGGADLPSAARCVRRPGGSEP
jgi:hypothetical protein